MAVLFITMACPGGEAEDILDCLINIVHLFTTTNQPEELMATISISINSNELQRMLKDIQDKTKSGKPLSNKEQTAWDKIHAGYLRLTRYIACIPHLILEVFGSGKAWNEPNFDKLVAPFHTMLLASGHLVVNPKHFYKKCTRGKKKTKKEKTNKREIDYWHVYNDLNTQTQRRTMTTSSLHFVQLIHRHTIATIDPPGMQQDHTCSKAGYMERAATGSPRRRRLG